MPSRLARIILFLSGYLPLFAIFTIQYYSKYGGWAVIPLGIGVVSALGLWGFLTWVRRGEPRPMHVDSVQRKDAEVIAYIFAYVFPFLGLNVENTANVVGLGIFFLVLMILNVSSNMIHINPTLNLLGFHVYEITTNEGHSHTVVTRRARLVRETELSVVVIGDDLSMEK